MLILIEKNMLYVVTINKVKPRAKIIQSNSLFKVYSENQRNGNKLYILFYTHQLSIDLFSYGDNKPIVLMFILTLKILICR